MKTRRTMCVALAVALFALSACGPPAKEANAPGADETSAETVDAFIGIDPTETLSGELMTTTDLDRTTESETAHEETSTADETESEIKAPVGGSIAQVVEFYNLQSAAIKTVDRITVKKHDVREIDMHIPSMLKALAPKDMVDSFEPNKNETISENFVNGRGTKDTSRRLNDFMPVNGKPIVSQLKASHVQSASCVAQGDGWVVRINLKDEKLDAEAMRRSAGDIENMSEVEREKRLEEMLANSPYFSCMEIGFNDFPGSNNRAEVQASGVSPMAGKMEGAFQKGAITATFDKDGRLTSLVLSYTNYMNASFFGMKISMNGVYKQNYQFTW